MITSDEFESRITLRLPVVVRKRVDGKVKERRAETRKFSMNDWLVEAVREKLDGGGVRLPAPAARENLFSGGSVAGPRFDPLSIPGVSKGMPTSGASELEGSSPWVPALKRFAGRGDEGDREFYEKVGAGFKPPPKWGLWSLETRARYLDEHFPLEGS